jgi:HEAT repeat protein
MERFASNDNGRTRILSPTPALTNALQEKELDWMMRVDVATHLGQWGQEARPAVPALVKMLSEPRYAVREAVTNALKEIAPEVLESNKLEGQSVN